jgi:excisionase family DNA binding protein
MQENQTQIEKPLKAKEVAEVLGVSKRTVLTWHQNGVIPSLFNVNRIIRFSLRDVMENLETQSVKLYKSK